MQQLHGDRRDRASNSIPQPATAAKATSEAAAKAKQAEKSMPKPAPAAPTPAPAESADDIVVSNLNYMKLKRHMKDNGFSDAEVNAAPGKPTLLHMWNSRNK